MPDPLWGEIWRLDFEPTRGSETGKVRPAVVISDEGLGRLAVRLVVPITGWKSHYNLYAWMTRLDPSPTTGLTKLSAADALQMRVASLERFQNRIGVLPEELTDQIAASIAVCIRLRTESQNAR